MDHLKSATISDVAREAGVSKSTVSAVMNGSRRTSDATRERVLEAARSLNYQPSAGARRLRDTGNRAIGLLIKEIGNPFYDEVMLGVHACARDAGYISYVASSEGRHEEERRIIDDFRKKGVDGLIISPMLSDDTDLANLFMLHQERFPFVLLERIFGIQASIVDIDNVAASKQAVQYLIREGHTHIMHFAGPGYSMHSRERVEGVRQAFSESHLVFQDDTVITAGASFADGRRAAMAHFASLDNGAHPTAVTCFNDLVALGVWQALNEIGLRVPEDVSIIGFDDIEQLQYLPYQLSTVRGQNRKIGEVAADVLIRQIEAASAPTIERVYLDTELIIRDSTRSLRVGAPSLVPSYTSSEAAAE